MFDKKSDEPLCPRFKTPCKKRGCTHYLMIRGHDPNTGKELDQWDCVDIWQAKLLIENSQQQRQTAAAVESFRNEMVKQNQETAALLRNSRADPVGPSNQLRNNGPAPTKYYYQDDDG